MSIINKIPLPSSAVWTRHPCHQLFGQPVPGCEVLSTGALKKGYRLKFNDFWSHTYHLRKKKRFYGLYAHFFQVISEIKHSKK